MALLDLNHGTTRGAIAPAQGLLATIRGYLTRRALYRETVKELSNLSDRDLADMGISRYEITSVATAAVNGTR